jgi:hypothetical protein
MIHVLFRCDRNDFKEVSIEVTARRAFALRCTLNLLECYFTDQL